MSYRALDMREHLDEVKNDSQALVVINPPTYKAGYEKFYDTNGNMTWKEPEYSLFDPKTGVAAIAEKVKDAKCLVVFKEENSCGKTAGSPVFSLYGIRNGINAYMNANRPDEVARLAEGKKIARPASRDIYGLDCSMLPLDYEISESSKIQVLDIEPKVAQYYRRLWTHNFTGAAGAMNKAVLIDGKIAGVFGFDKSSITIGAFGKEVSNSIFLMYGMSAPHKFYRLPRLNVMLAQDRCVVKSVCTDLEFAKVKSLKTVLMTKHPEAKDKRGLMKLISRREDKIFGYRLTYQSDLKDRTEQETLTEWLGRENKWQKMKNRK